MDSPDCPFCRKLAHLDALPADELLAEWPYAVVLLGPWQFYQGYCIVVARRHASELSQLSLEERQGYFDEMCRAARVIEECFQPLKLNYELLGNLVPHLHWHLFPRYHHDPEVLKPVWLALDRADRDDAEKHRLSQGLLDKSAIAARLRDALANTNPKR